MTWREIFSILHSVTGHEYDVKYHPVSEAWQLQNEAKAKNDDKLEMQASHRIVQGTEGTLLPKPYDNNKFPNVKVTRVEETYKKMLGSK